jgi:hypothetical protein
LGDDHPGAVVSSIHGSGVVRAQCIAVVPTSVRGAVEAWRAAGSPSQAGIAWPRQRWIGDFAADAATFAMLPDHLTRQVVRGACQRAAESTAEAKSAFLVVMAWGYGRVGYGPFRVRRLLDAAPGAGAELQAAARALREAGPVAAYARLGDHGVARLARLGPAFGTKFLYFCSPPGDRPALILDRLIARWLRGNAGLVVNQIRWHVPTYRRYLASMYAWAGELAIAADELEMCIFSEQARLAGSQWA